jgi:uncharacterized protein (TIGR02996 family)
MPDADAFLRTIAETPADDGPRLVYADWLEEQGESDRAEFIRLQIELARPEADEDLDRWKKVRRVEVLLAEHWYEWSSPVFEELGDPLPFRPGAPRPPPPRRGLGERFLRRLLGGWIPGPPEPSPYDYELNGTAVVQGRLRPTSMSQRNLRSAKFTRGFADRLELFAWPELTPEVLHRLTTQCPLSDLVLHGLIDRWERRDGPHFSHLTSLTVSPMAPANGSIEPVLEELLAALGASPHLTGLKSLGIPGMLNAATITQLAGSALLARLDDLSIAVATDGIQALANHSEFARLKQLDLTCDEVTTAAFERFVESSSATALHELHLCELGDSSAAITGALTASRNVSQLRTLFYSRTYHYAPVALTQVGVGALAGSTELPVLRELAIWGHEFDADILAPLFNATGLPRLRSLDLAENGLNNNVVAALANGSLASRLSYLNLSRNLIDDAGALELARSPGMDRLQRLIMSGNSLGPVGIKALRDRFGDRAVF